MQYQVLVRRPAETHFVASVVGLSDVVADGQTEEEAIDNVKAVLVSQLESAKLVTIEIESTHTSMSTDENGSTYIRGSENDPWVKYAGVFADDPSWDDFQAEIEAYRKEVDEKTNR